MKGKRLVDVREVKTLEDLNSTEKFQKCFSSGKNVGTSVSSQKESTLR